jgi:hypothetical protein
MIAAPLLGDDDCRRLLAYLDLGSISLTARSAAILSCVFAVSSLAL